MYFIYHIPGVKIGCTTNPRKRILLQQKYSEWEILEEHLDIDTASIRELELQKKYGYATDSRSYTTFTSSLVGTRDALSYKQQGAKQKGKSPSDETRRKMSENRKGKAAGPANQNYGKWSKGKGSLGYGTGAKYHEITTGFIGYALEVKETFGSSSLQTVINCVKSSKPVKWGKLKGLQFKIYEE